MKIPGLEELETALRKVESLIRGKQDKLTGTAGQVVGFDSTGKPVAQSTESLRGPKGDTGATGATGAKGDTGAAGAKGATGTRGSTWTTGTAITGTSTTGAVFSSSGITSALVGDMYLNSSTWNVYKCTTAGAASAAKWAYVCNIRGAAGATGAQGPKGDTGATGATGAKGDTGAAGAKGATGTRGSTWTTGTAITGTSTTGTVFSSSGITSALVGDMYLNSSTWNVYKCTTAGAASAAKWAYVCNIRGAAGATGAQGPKGDTGATGATGAKGDTGAAGAKGATGTRGSTWTTGTAITGTSTTGTVFSSSGITSALVGDMYLNSSTWNVYKCTTAGAASAAKWTYVCNIRGAAGATGAQGPKGDTGAAGAKGATGAKGDKGDPGLLYGTCETAAATAAKTVSLTGFSLVTGSVVAVKFTYANTAASPTLNVNSTGAKAIKKYGTTAADTYMWAAGAVVVFVYDGTNWVMSQGTLATTTYYGLTKLSSSVTSASTTLAATPSAVKQAYDLADSKQSKPLKGSFTIPASGWSTDSTTGYTKYYDVAVTGVTVNDRADIIIAPGSVQAAADCGFCPVSETLAGKIRIRATKVPTAAIAAEYWIEKE